MVCYSGILTIVGTIVEACSHTVDQFAAGAVLYQVRPYSFCLLYDTNTCPMLDWLFHDNASSRGTRRRYHVTSLPFALFLYPSIAFYRKDFLEIHIRALLKKRRSILGSVEMSPRPYSVSQAGDGASGCLRSFILVSKCQLEISPSTNYVQPAH